ncbi:2-phospho-L-lactate guanylyltransferase [Salinigranum rubrum]|uniref:2-phospho-L-lactate guanylyltransferase n=1 Tax=Salinigranum rubrum TaxID=755307 RepID=A0A2I8VS45_9EURY|nr:2-phospho-L-lactate guanylyltransferase [Salinigranum rubrum]AUV84039.1 2-phospho-L-lactate guanylyltransferase [Salinigranum rubrum]
MRVVVPFDATDPKTRLAPVLDATERREFARCMLRDVLDAVVGLSRADAVAGVDVAVDVVSTAPLDPPLERDVDSSDSDPSVTVRVDDRSLDSVVDDAIAETVGEGEAGASEPLVVVMADLALATPDALSRLVQPDEDVVLVPGRGLGTNALVVRTPAFRTDFHGASYLDHRRAAADVGTVGTVDSFRLATDVDEPADLVEAFVHGGERTRDWLTSRFELAVSEAEGRVTLARR